MSKKQVMLVGLDPTRHELEYLFDNDEILFHLAEDVDEAVEMSGFTTIEVMILSATLVEGDALAEVKKIHGLTESSSFPVVIVTPDQVGDAEVILKGDGEADYDVRKPGLNKLPAVIELSAAQCRLAAMDLEQELSLLKQLSLVGFNENKDIGSLEVFFQTEITTFTLPPRMRSRAYLDGKIVLNRESDLDSDELTLEEATALASEFHQGTIAEAKQNLD